MNFLSNPHKIWCSGKFNLQRIVLKLAFSEPLVYCRETGYRTPKTALPFKVLAGISGGKKLMVRLKGENLNSLFEELADWEHQLKHSEIDFTSDFEGPSL
ncbi:MAG: hypothetical protein COB49_11265 [Alphaproteobacteria bacterium]|nr:MAG: hypothetical protein COB49_11265 [Alphaproteobacteria bacterium]